MQRMGGFFRDPAWREMTKKLTRYPRSRVLIAELVRVLRRRGPTHESKHFLKTSELAPMR